MTDIKELERKIKEAAEAYYNGNAIMSDDEFDELIDELRAINPDSNVLNTIGWGFQPTGNKKPHKYQTVGSLGKAREYKQISSLLRERDIILSAKLDGISAVLYFVNGKLSTALTRGNGKEGKDITNKIRKIVKNMNLNNINTGLIRNDFTGAIRGELIITNSNWERLKNRTSEYKNSRNAVAGIINKDDIDYTIDYISFIAYNVLGIENVNTNMYTQTQVLAVLSDIFGTDYVVPHRVLFLGEHTDLELYYKKWSVDYPIDGCVITDNFLTIKNDTVLYNQQAYKFQSERKYSKVVNIDWNLTKTNKLVPTIEIEPIDLAGATITRATAFNAQYVKDNNIYVGSVVEIERSGEVIPKIIRTVSAPDAFEWTMPNVCPVCGSELVWNSVDLVCESPDCPNIAYRDLQQWVNVIGETDGIGDTLMFKFLDEANITCIDDLYNKDWIHRISGGVQASKFVEAMNKVLYGDVTLDKALLALNIPRLGKTTCKTLKAHGEVCRTMFSNIVILGGITENTEKDLLNIVGVATTSSIVNNIRRLKNIKYIVDRIVYEKSSTVTASKGKVAITGKLSMKRSEFEKILNDAGYTVDNLTKDTLYLITDDPNSGSSKNVKADKLGIKKITESDMLALIG